MKKFLPYILVFVILTSLCACGEDKTEDITITYHDLYLDISLEQNFLLATYDIEIFFDNTRLGLIPHGEMYTHLLSDVASGEHTIIYYKNNDHSIKKTSSVIISEDSTYIATIHSKRDNIEIKSQELFSGVFGNALEMPDLNNVCLKTGIEKLKQIGFVNINCSDDAWDSSEWTIINQNIYVTPANCSGNIASFILI